MPRTTDHRNSERRIVSLFALFLALLVTFRLTTPSLHADCELQPPAQVREEPVDPNGLNASVAATAAGDFIVTWQTTPYQLGQDFVCDVRARRFCADGSALGTEGTLSSQGDPGALHYDPSAQCTRGGLHRLHAAALFSVFL